MRQCCSASWYVVCLPNLKLTTLARSDPSSDLEWSPRRGSSSSDGAFSVVWIFTGFFPSLLTNARIITLGKKGKEMKCHSPRPLTCLLMIHITVVTSNTLQLIHIRSFAHFYSTMVGLSKTSWTVLHSDQPPFWHHVKRLP